MELKRAFLTPLIKKIILDAEIVKNYRPVSNLSFLSKSIERIVCVQLINRLDKMVYMEYSGQLTDSCTVRKQHYFVYKNDIP